MVIDDWCETMENVEQQSPLGGANSLVVSSLNGARLRHLARPEVPVRVRARHLREHEVVREVVVVISRVSACSHGCKANLVTVTTQDTPLLVNTHLSFRSRWSSLQDTLVVPFSLVFSHHKLMGGRRGGHSGLRAL